MPTATRQTATLQISAARKPDTPFFQKTFGMKGLTPDQQVRVLPFSHRDGTCGTENELQAVVIGQRKDLDLAITIENSNYYKNILRRAAAGDTSRKKLLGIEKYLAQKTDRLWENSWVRFPGKSLNPYASLIFRSDLKSDKTDPRSPDRSDAGRFRRNVEGEEFIRIPVSYLLKLSLAQAVGDTGTQHPFIRISGEQMMAHFSNDNTSPEIFSFHPVRAVSSDTLGHEAAKETLLRFVFTQLLVSYAEETFQLKKHGQEVRVFFSAAPPTMQKQICSNISDTFYRYLFMSPCLSGWSRGEEKFNYMKLCHQVLSRSQINSIAKLKEAGIINSNLVVLPSASNVSLANNGTHISMGSRKISRMITDPANAFTARHEKQIGDLVIKISEHFLSLFPGIYSASPYRLDFYDFHPEKVLGFLPHEIDYTHLRMIWRRWKRKAKISILGNPLTPFGPVWLDKLVSRIFLLKGDFVPDYRLIDYFVSLMSTDESPALNGISGNGELLKKDLAQAGIFHERMPLYQMVRLREHSQMGYSGFEHRYFSIFENIQTDMGNAADLQNLITLLAYHYILSGQVTHEMIPDTPDVESERRQIFFCAAINLPTFFVKTSTRNGFLKKILARIEKKRSSRRYQGYTRIRIKDYRKALLEILKTDGAPLIENLRLKFLIPDLETRMKNPARSVSGKLVSGIMAGEKKVSPMHLAGQAFNRRAEHYYIQDLRRQHLKEGFDLLEEEFRQLDLWASFRDAEYNQAIQAVLGNQEIMAFLKTAGKAYQEDRLPEAQVRKLIRLMVLLENKKNKDFQQRPEVALS